jgi:hypothetical protein
MAFLRNRWSDQPAGNEADPEKTAEPDTES